MKELSTWLRRANLSQAELSRLSQTSTTLLCDVLKGRKRFFSAHTARRISDALERFAESERLPPPPTFEVLAGLPPRKTQRIPLPSRPDSGALKASR